MATERWLMLGVEAGGDRQALHEVIRTNSLATAEAVSRGEPNDLLERLAADPTFAKVPSQDAQGRAGPATVYRPLGAAGGRVPRRVPAAARWSGPVRWPGRRSAEVTV